VRSEVPTTGAGRLRIGIDAHAIGGRLTGNERYIANLIPALTHGSDHAFVLYFTRPDAMADWRGLPRTTLRLLRPAHPVVRIPVGLPWHARRDRLDVLLVQYAGPPVPTCPIVTIVHDVAFALYPEYYSRLERIWMPRAIPSTMRRAAAVVTVSGFSSSEIARVYAIPTSKITVSYNAVGRPFRTPGPNGSPDRVDPYFLAVGNLQPRKNLTTLLDAYRRLIAEHPERRERLLIVGQRWRHAHGTLHAAEDLRRSGRLAFVGYVSDERLVELLRGATAFAYPSIYEGFGLPPLEALAVGTPTIVGDIPVMREVLGEAALRVPTKDPAAWAEALLRVATDPPLREDLVERGRRVASRFTPEASAEPVLAALEAAARKRRR
jgi:glycosyltransferase involved in cell wall biosynthesis